MTIKINVSTEPFPQYRSGKVIMQQQEWAFKKCMDCGGELELILNNEYEEVKQCKDCGRRTLLVKKIRDGLKGDRLPFEKAISKWKGDVE